METTRPSLLLRIRDHTDSAAWRAFDAVYRPMLYRFARASGLGHDDAEDTAQQCLVGVSEHIGEFAYDPQRGRFKSWLRTLVNNRVRNLLRARRERQGQSGDFQAAQQCEPAPEEAFDKIWMEGHLWHCLREIRAEVEEATFLAFQYYVIEQRPLETVCAALNLTPNNVYTIKWRLTERVAAKMKELLGDLE